MMTTNGSGNDGRGVGGVASLYPNGRLESPNTHRAIFGGGSGGRRSGVKYDIDDAFRASASSDESSTLYRVLLPSSLMGIFGMCIFPRLCRRITRFVIHSSTLHGGNMHSLSTLVDATSNFVSTIGLLYSILMGQVYGFLYGQQEVRGFFFQCATLRVRRAACRIAALRRRPRCPRRGRGGGGTRDSGERRGVIFVTSYHPTDPGRIARRLLLSVLFLILFRSLAIPPPTLPHTHTPRVQHPRTNISSHHLLPIPGAVSGPIRRGHRGEIAIGTGGIGIAGSGDVPHVPGIDIEVRTMRPPRRHDAVRQI